MLFLMISCLAATAVTGYLVNKWLVMEAKENDRKFQLNNERKWSAEQVTVLCDDLKEQVDELQSMRAEFNALKQQFALSNNRR